jgi:hypothetical protein
MFSSGRLCGLFRMNGLHHFLAVDRVILGSLESHASSISSDLDDADGDLLSTRSHNDNVLARLPRQNQHLILLA